MEKPNLTEAKRDVPIHTISLREAWDTASEADLFIQGLKDLNIYSPDYLYTGFDGSNIDKPKISGDIVFCSTEQQLSALSAGGTDDNALRYAFDSNSPAIAVYDSSKLSLQNGPEYKIKGPDALVAIIKLAGHTVRRSNHSDDEISRDFLEGQIISGALDDDDDLFR